MLAEAAVNEVAVERRPRRWALQVESARRLLPVVALAGSRGLALLAQFAAQIIVGTLAGASGLGILQLFTSWVCIAGEVLAMGLPARAMRQVAVACAHGEVRTIEQILQESRRRILRCWIWLALLLAPVSLWVGLTDGIAEWGVYYWLSVGTLCTAPLFALGRLYSESLKATGAVLTAVTLENLVSPLTILSLCAGCWLLSQPLLALSLLVAFGASVAIIPIALRLAMGQQLARLPVVPAPPARVAGGRVAALPDSDLLYLWGNGVLNIAFLQMPFLIMPIYIDTAQIGVFSMAHKLVNIITTLLLLLAAVYGPRFALCAVQIDSVGLERLLRRTQVISIIVYTPAALLLIALSTPLASLFGPEFGEMRDFLFILCVGQLINAGTGLCGVLLNMAGRARQELLALCLTTAVAIIASLLVGPVHGAMGLACVFSGSIALKNLTSYWMVTRELKAMRVQS